MTSVTCHDAADRVLAEIRVPNGADDPAALCASVTASQQLGTIKAPVVACAGAHGAADVYPSTERSPATCARHGAQPYGSTK